MTHHDEDLRRLRAADPVSPERLRGAARSARAQRVLDDILQARRPRRVPRRGTVAVAAALVVALAGSLLVGRRREEAPIESARLVLFRAAEMAAAGDVPMIAPGEFLYLRTEVLHRVTTVGRKATWTALVPKTREVWIAADGSGRVLETSSGKPRFLGTGDRVRWIKEGRPPLSTPTSDRAVGPGNLLPSEQNELPTAVGQLRRTLLREAPTKQVDPRVALFVKAADILSKPLVDPDLRAALYRLLAGIEGIQLLGERRDELGRVGTGIAVTSQAPGPLERRVLIFDRTSAVLAEQVVLLEPVDWMEVEPPVMTDARLFFAPAVVPSIDSRPPGGDEPLSPVTRGGQQRASRYPRTNARDTMPALLSQPNLDSRLPMW